jgi:serine/threonine protein kinase
MARRRGQLGHHGSKTTVDVGTRVDGFRVERIVSTRPGLNTLAEAATLRGERVTLGVVARPLKEDRELRRRVARLIPLRASVDHPNVLRLLKAVDGGQRLHMESIPRGAVTLADLLADGPLERTQALKILGQVAGALETARAKGLVHRALSPRSIVVEPGEEPRVFLTDFGIGAPRGLPCELPAALEDAAYRAPEEVRGEAPEPASNVYSLTCMLVECLTGSPPYAYSRPLLTLHAQLTAPPPRLAECDPSLPAEVDEVIARGLAKDPREREGSSGALVNAAAHAVGLHVPIPVARAARKQRAAAPAHERRPAHARRAAPQPPARPAPSSPKRHATTPPRTEKPPRRREKPRAGEKKPSRGRLKAPWRREKPAHAEKPSRRAEKPAGVEKPPRRAEKPARVEKPPRGAEKPVRAEKPAHAAKPPRRADKPAQAEKPPRRGEKPTPRRDKPPRQRDHATSKPRRSRGLRRAPALAALALAASAVAGFATGNSSSSGQTPSPTPASDVARQAPSGPADSTPVVSRAVDRLDARRAAIRKKLKAAKRARGQAAAARTLAAAYGTAEAKVARAASTDAEEQLAERLADAEAAYLGLAAAGRQADRRSWRAAREAALESERELELLLRTRTWI